MIPGFNLDIKHKGKTFHIQTEDSGPANPVIMTHLFLFGSILGTRRLEYGDAVNRPDMADHVRELMRIELKAMHSSLLAGEFDEISRRPQKKPGGEIPLARKTGNHGPTLSPAAAPPVGASTAPPAMAPVPFTDEPTDLVSRPASGPGVRVVEPLATLDLDDLLDAEDLVESVNEGEVELASGISGELSGELSGDDLVSVIEEPAARTQSLPVDRSTIPAMLPRAATPVRAPRAGVEFPTDLVADTRFDEVILAWLLEDVDEP